MSEATKEIALKGRVIFRFEIKAETGLHIGGSDTGIEIGGVDKTVIRDPLTGTPYIPGSSLKGKMRSLIEKYHECPQNQRIGNGYIHSCGGEYSANDYKKAEILKKVKEEYATCEVCQTFGLPGERPFATPTRLVVRDIHLSDTSAEELTSANTDLPYTEVKTEVSIDRVTSEANPRQLERVPAGAIFEDGEMVYSLYEGTDMVLADDIARLKTVLEGLALLEDDYLGGSGSRGSGKVKVQKIRVFLRKDYAKKAEELTPTEGYTVPELAAELKGLQEEITKQIAAKKSE